MCLGAGHSGYSNAHDVRWFLYHDLFSGAFGHTYGNHAVWQMHDPKRGAAIEGPIRTWTEAGSASAVPGIAISESCALLHPGCARSTEGAVAWFQVPSTAPFPTSLTRLCACVDRDPDGGAGVWSRGPAPRHYGSHCGPAWSACSSRCGATRPEQACNPVRPRVPARGPRVAGSGVQG